MSTTNGTRALGVGQEGARVLPCAFTNLGAVSAGVRDEDHLVILCAGQDDRFSLDDALCAGQLVPLLEAYQVAVSSFASAAWLVFPARRYVPARVRALAEWLAEVAAG